MSGDDPEVGFAYYNDEGAPRVSGLFLRSIRQRVSYHRAPRVSGVVPFTPRHQHRQDVPRKSE